MTHWQKKFPPTQDEKIKKEKKKKRDKKRAEERGAKEEKEKAEGLSLGRGAAEKHKSGAKPKKRAHNYGHRKNGDP